MLIESLRIWRRTLQPVLDNTPQRGDTVATVRRELTKRVPFGDPSFEPDALTMDLVRSVSPPEGPPAISTQPSLLGVTAPPVAAD